MYNNLLFGVKRRILDESKDAFLEHPAYADKVRVYNKFPYEERVQYGIVLRNSSASQVRMSADNYLADLISHVRLGKFSNAPGISVEWARENGPNMTDYVEENVSGKVDPTQRRFFTDHPMCSGRGNTAYATNVGQIRVTIDGAPVLPEFIDGKKGLVMLPYAPSNASTVVCSYHYRTVDIPGIYIINFTSDTEFNVLPTYVVDRELVIERTTGAETEAYLGHTPVYNETDRVYTRSRNGGNPFFLVRGTDYTIDNTSGKLTFISPLGINNYLYADYKYLPNPATPRGPFSFRPYQEVHDAISGVVLCMGGRAKEGDQQIIVLSEFREPQARIYGGHWEMSLNLGVIAKDPSQMEEMADQITGYLWGKRKNELEKEGITLSRVEPTGESEESFIDTTGDLYYESSVDVSLMSEWQEFVPYYFEIKHILVGLNEFNANSIVSYTSSGQGSLNVGTPIPDTRKVITHPTIGFERVS